MAVRLFEQIADRISGLIRDGQLGPGDRLPAERDLARLLGVSRPSLRESMVALEMAGLIAKRTGDATYVLGQAAVDNLVPDPPSGLDKYELLENAAMIESQIVSDICEMTEASWEFSEDAPTFLKSFAAPKSYRFHRSLLRRSPNQLLANVGLKLWHARGASEWLKLSNRLKLWDIDRTLVQERRNLLKALDEHDGREARRIMVRSYDRMSKLISA